MVRQGLTGSRIRERRLARGLKQADLALEAGVSASYLNLIEHNRRRIGGKLLVALAQALEVEPTQLSEGADSTLIDALEAVADSVPAAAAERDRTEEFAGRFPGWAALVREQGRRIDRLEQVLSGLNDRLTHDPVLSEKMHEVLAAVAAIRSTSSILVETPNIDADWRQRFHLNIDTESRRLAETSAAMAAHFDRLSRGDAGFATPMEAASTFMERRGFHIARIEADGAVAIPRVLDEAEELAAPAARRLAGEMLESYAADAQTLPLQDFVEAATEESYDPAALATRFQTDLPRVFRRLASLPRDPGRPEIGFVSCDAAGAILQRKPATGFALPRFGAACPLWPLFAALRSPGMPLRERLESAEGAPFAAYAMAQPLDSTSFETAPVLRASMVLVALAPETAGALKPVGSSCRVCARQGCAARREPSILQSAG